MDEPVQLESLSKEPELTRQVDLMRRLSAVLKADARCLGAAVGGSLADGRADRLSDVDLVVYCKAGSAGSVLSSLSAAAADVQVVHRLAGRHDDASVYEKVILADWSSYELHVVEPSTRMRLQPPFVELLNRENYLSSRIALDKPIGRGTAAPLVNGESGLIWELFNCIKWLQRGEVPFTTHYLQVLGQRLASSEPPQ